MELGLEEKVGSRGEGWVYRRWLGLEERVGSRGELVGSRGEGWV